MTSQEAIFRIVTPQDVAGTSAEATSGPGFLFVECSGHDGRVESRVRPLVNRHVMLNHVFQETGDTEPRGNGALSSSSQPTTLLARTTKPERPRKFTFVATKAKQKRTARRTSASTPIKHEHTSATTPPKGLRRTARPPSPLISNAAIENVCRWWFDARSDLRPSFEIAKSHWVESAWDMARRSDTVYECVALYAARKKAQTFGVWSDYMLQEAKCIRSMSQEIAKPATGPRPLLPVAIGVLAYLALLDKQLGVAITHLEAIKSLWGAYSFENTRQEWVYVVWLDLRFAMHLGRAPILEYFLPKCFRGRIDLELPFDVEQISADMAEHCTWLCPPSERMETSMTLRLFTGIFHLFLSWPAYKTAEQTPFGRVYDLDYWLCTLRSRVLPLSVEGLPSSATCAELLLTTMQLHVWIVTRFWAPIGTASRNALLARACRLMKSSSAIDFIASWRNQGDIASLLWISATITTCALEIGLELEAVPLDVLSLVVEQTNINDFKEFSVALKEWPWIENWHSVKYVKLWDLIDGAGAVEGGPVLVGLRNTAKPTILGGLEFYDE